MSNYVIQLQMNCCMTCAHMDAFEEDGRYFMCGCKNNEKYLCYVEPIGICDAFVQDAAENVNKLYKTTEQ